MNNEDSMMHFLELQKQYEKRFEGKTIYQLYPRTWYKIEDFDALSQYLEEALEKNVLLNELDSIYELEKKDLDRRFQNAIDKGVKSYEEKYLKNGR